jgi:hypothetical protein
MPEDKMLTAALRIAQLAASGPSSGRAQDERLLGFVGNKLPPTNSYAYVFCLLLCHSRADALRRSADCCPEPDDAALIDMADNLLFARGISPRDFGFVDPATIH